MRDGEARNVGILCRASGKKYRHDVLAVRTPARKSRDYSEWMNIDHETAECGEGDGSRALPSRQGAEKHELREP